jgi:ubiquinone/menaquinone biosynthesis C-methylase UbiE
VNEARSVDEQIAELAARYSQRANAYDRLWSPVLQPVASRLLAQLPLATARDVIDVGTGAGAMLPALRQAAPEARVLGVDNAEGMLLLAERRHAGPLARMDVEQLELGDDQFDVALIAFVLFHLPHPERCLSEVCRVLRHGGSVGTATWGAERYPAADAVWVQELDRAGARTFPLPAVQNRECCDSEAKMTGLLQAAGFGSIRSWTDRLVHCWAPGQHFEHQVLVSSRLRLQSLDGRAREACLQIIRARVEALRDDDYVHTGDVIMATATRP